MRSLLYTSDDSVWWGKWLDNPIPSINKLIVAWDSLSFFWMKTLKQRIFLASWHCPMTSGGNCSSKGRFFTAADAIVNIRSTKTARLNRKMRSSSLEQNKTKSENGRISLKLPQSRIRMQKPFAKGTRWSKMIWVAYLYNSILNYIQISMAYWIMLWALDSQVLLWFLLEVYLFSYLTFQGGCYLQHGITQYWRDKRK